MGYRAVVPAMLIVPGAIGAAAPVWSAPGVALLVALWAVMLWAVLCFFVYRSRMAHAQSTRVINETAERIDETKRKLEVASERIHSLHSFTHELSVCSNRPEVVGLVCRALVEKFRYDSSMFWWVDRHSGKLRCLASIGYSDACIAGLANTMNGETGAGGPSNVLREVMETGQTVLVRNARGEARKRGGDFQQLVSFLNLSSFVMAPLHKGGRPVGLISAEFHRGDLMDTRDLRLVESISSTIYDALAKDELRVIDERDRHLMGSISTFVGDMLEKIELFEDMEKQVEQRTRKLLDTHRQLAKTREMVIQSEKLSALGRMAAGVLHEINDPLNFLINILPDLRKDIHALAQARQIIRESANDAALRAQLDALDRDYDLENHLEELDFVFDRAHNALEKSARISQGLNVFSGNAQPQKVERLDLLSLASDALEVIPAKLRGQTQIVVHRSPDIFWEVNSGQMEQVFINVFNNAIDALEHKGCVEVWGERVDDGVMVTITDNGPGIPEEVRRTIFEPFYTTKPPGKSTGLGLSICAEIVRKFGGIMEAVEPSRAGGACFVIRFSQELKEGGVQ